MKEIWKIIKDFPFYEVSTYGRIKSKYTNRILKPKKHPKGYLYIGLSKEKIKYTKKIHRIVAENFLDYDQNRRLVNHKNGNKSDNRVKNLNWSTNKENIHHAIELYGKDHYSSMLGKTGIKNKCHKKLYQYSLKGELIKIWSGHREMQRNLGFNRQGIYYHIKNNTSSIYGFKWEI